MGKKFGGNGVGGVNGDVTAGYGGRPKGHVSGGLSSCCEYALCPNNSDGLENEFRNIAKYERTPISINLLVARCWRPGPDHLQTPQKPSRHTSPEGPSGGTREAIRDYDAAITLDDPFYPAKPRRTMCYNVMGERERYNPELLTLVRVQMVSFGALKDSVSH